jgi:hypothetical protein
MRTIAAAVLALSLSACTAEPAPAPAPPAEPAPAAPAGPYPLTTCVISGDALGSMGDPVVFTHEGVEVRLCCGACRKDFDKDPAAHLAKIAAARAAAKPAPR